MRILALWIGLSLLSVAGFAVAPGPPEEFPGEGDFPADPPDLPGGACDHFPDGDLPASDNVPGWVDTPSCA